MNVTEDGYRVRTMFSGEAALLFIGGVPMHLRFILDGLSEEVERTGMTFSSGETYEATLTIRKVPSTAVADAHETL